MTDYTKEKQQRWRERGVIDVFNVVGKDKMKHTPPPHGTYRMCLFLKSY
jgi:hypothetical protein